MNELSPEEGRSPVLYWNGWPATSWRAYCKWMKVSSSGGARCHPLPQRPNRKVTTAITTLPNPNQSISYRCDNSLVLPLCPVTFSIFSASTCTTIGHIIHELCWVCGKSIRIRDLDKAL